MEFPCPTGISMSNWEVILYRYGKPSDDITYDINGDGTDISVPNGPPLVPILIIELVTVC